MKNNTQGFSAISVIIIILILAAGAFYYYSNNSTDTPTDSNKTEMSDDKNEDKVSDNKDAEKDSDDELKDLVGNKDLDTSKMPKGVVDALNDINAVVSDTDDCATKLFSVAVPEGWQCRKLNDNAGDVTVHTSKNTLTVSVGTGQGMSSCDVIPGCKKKDVNLSDQFTSMVENIQPSIGSVEIVGTYQDNSSIKVLVTSNDAISEGEMQDIRTILDSVESK